MVRGTCLFLSCHLERRLLASQGVQGLGAGPWRAYICFGREDRKGNSLKTFTSPHVKCPSLVPGPLVLTEEGEGEGEGFRRSDSQQC